MKVNIIMMDDSELKEINIFRNRELGDSIVHNKDEIEKLLDFENTKIVFFGSKYIQGWFIPKQISEYSFIDDEEETSAQLLNHIKDTSGYWDINYNDVRDWIMENRDRLLKILR